MAESSGRVRGGILIVRDGLLLKTPRRTLADLIPWSADFADFGGINFTISGLVRGGLVCGGFIPRRTSGQVCGGPGGVRADSGWVHENFTSIIFCTFHVNSRTKMNDIYTLICHPILTYIYENKLT